MKTQPIMDSVTIELTSNFLQQHFQEIQFLALFGGMAFLFIIEGLFPRREKDERHTRVWLSNIALALLNHFMILFLTFAVVILIHPYQPKFSLIQYIGLNNVNSFFVFLIMIEFLSYWIHRAYHHIPLLWRIHSVHHSDIAFDVTTSHRHHPIESLIHFALMMPVMIFFGAPLIVIAAHSFINTAISLISHSNIYLPRRLDSLFRWLVITPDYHRIHHMSKQIYTDSNYGSIVPWFDYLFKTSSQIPFEPLAKMKLGLKTHRKLVENRLDKLLLQPFFYRSK